MNRKHYSSISFIWYQLRVNWWNGFKNINNEICTTLILPTWWQQKTSSKPKKWQPKLPFWTKKKKKDMTALVKTPWGRFQSHIYDHITFHSMKTTHGQKNNIFQHVEEKTNDYWPILQTYSARKIAKNECLHQ